MTARDMDHMQFLGTVASSDVMVLEKKEETYQGSWKASGGRSAWFMFRRNMDRLLEMMKKPEPPHGFSVEDLSDTIAQAGASPSGDCTMDWTIAQYLRDSYISENIFAAIRDEPSGQDGTVLAVLRDLRRYALLIEAEMIARGVCGVEKTGVTGDKSQVSFSQIIIDVKKPKKKLHTADGEVIYLGHEYIHHDDGEHSTCRVEELHDNGQVAVLFGDNLSLVLVSPDSLTSLHSLPKANKQRTPEDGAQHTSIVPWAVDTEWRKLRGYLSSGLAAGQFNAFYKRRTADLWTLEEAVRASNAFKPPPEVQHLYHIEGDYYILKINACPPDARDFFPYLEKEANTVTKDQLPEWQRPLYWWSETETKWRLDEEASAWLKD